MCEEMLNTFHLHQREQRTSNMFPTVVNTFFSDRWEQSTEDNSTSPLTSPSDPDSSEIDSRSVFLLLLSLSIHCIYESQACRP